MQGSGKGGAGGPRGRSAEDGRGSAGGSVARRPAPPRPQPRASRPLHLPEHIHHGRGFRMESPGVICPAELDHLNCGRGSMGQCPAQAYTMGGSVGDINEPG